MLAPTPVGPNSSRKERRRETSNRIKHTKENLDRLLDVLEEVEKQIKHLDRQAKTAERYGRYKDDERRTSAELLALRGAAAAVGNHRLTAATLYVTLEPCPMCAGAIVHARVERLVYAASDPKSGAAGSLMDLTRDARLNHRVIVEGGLLADRAAALLQGFFRERRGEAERG